MNPALLGSLLLCALVPGCYGSQPETQSPIGAGSAGLPNATNNDGSIKLPSCLDDPEAPAEEVVRHLGANCKAKNERMILVCFDTECPALLFAGNVFQRVVPPESNSRALVIRMFANMVVGDPDAHDDPKPAGTYYELERVLMEPSWLEDDLKFALEILYSNGSFDRIAECLACITCPRLRVVVLECLQRRMFLLVTNYLEGSRPSESSGPIDLVSLYRFPGLDECFCNSGSPEPAKLFEGLVECVLGYGSPVRDWSSMPGYLRQLCSAESDEAQRPANPSPEALEEEYGNDDSTFVD